MGAALDFTSMNRDDHGYLDAMSREVAQMLGGVSADRSGTVQMLGLFRSSLLLHFLQEEEVMKEANYPGFFAHRFAHDAMTARLTALVSCYEAGREDLVTGSWPAVRGALHSHIGRYDAALGTFFETGADSAGRFG